MECAPICRPLVTINWHTLHMYRLFTILGNAAVEDEPESTRFVQHGPESGLRRPKRPVIILAKNGRFWVFGDFFLIFDFV